MTTMRALARRSLSMWGDRAGVRLTALNLSSCDARPSICAASSRWLSNTPCSRWSHSITTGCSSDTRPDANAVTSPPPLICGPAALICLSITTLSKAARSMCRMCVVYFVCSGKNNENMRENKLIIINNNMKARVASTTRAWWAARSAGPLQGSVPSMARRFYGGAAAATAARVVVTRALPDATLEALRTGGCAWEGRYWSEPETAIPRSTLLSWLSPDTLGTPPPKRLSCSGHKINQNNQTMHRALLPADGQGGRGGARPRAQPPRGLLHGTRVA